MSRTDNTDPEHLGGKWAKWSRPFANKHAPSWWKRIERQKERTKARQAIRNRREPEPKYERPYYY